MFQNKSNRNAGYTAQLYQSQVVSIRISAKPIKEIRNAQMLWQVAKFIFKHAKPIKNPYLYWLL